MSRRRNPRKLCSALLCPRTVCRPSIAHCPDHARVHLSLRHLDMAISDVLVLQDEYGHVNFTIWQDRIAPGCKKATARRSWHRFVRCLKNAGMTFTRDVDHNLVIR